MADPLNPFATSSASPSFPHHSQLASSSSDPHLAPGGHDTSRQYSQAGSPAGDAWGSPADARNGMVPRAARTTDDWKRPDTDEDDYGHRVSASEESPAAPARPVPQEGFVRIRILGIDRNRRDMYIKFNAEVSHSSSSRPSACLS